MFYLPHTPPTPPQLFLFPFSFYFLFLISIHDHIDPTSTLGLSDCKSHASLTLFIRYHELTNENVSYSLVNQSKTKIFTNQKITKNL